VVIGLGSRGAIGVNEQLFGSDEQVRGRTAADNYSLALAARWLHVMPHNFGSDEQIFGAR
jgi:hypothetical protein